MLRNTYVCGYIGSLSRVHTKSDVITTQWGKGCWSAWVCSRSVPYLEGSKWRPPALAMTTYVDCKEGNHKEVKLIIENLGKGAFEFDAKFSKGVLWFSPLHEAAANGHEALLEYWLELGYDVNCRTPSGDTPLHVAARNGRVGCVRTLLKHNAEVGAQNTIGKTPRQSVEQCPTDGQMECASILRSEGIQNALYAHEM